MQELISCTDAHGATVFPGDLVEILDAKHHLPTGVAFQVLHIRQQGADIVLSPLRRGGYSEDDQPAGLIRKVEDLCLRGSVREIDRRFFLRRGEGWYEVEPELPPVGWQEHDGGHQLSVWGFTLRILPAPVPLLGLKRWQAEVTHADLPEPVRTESKVWRLDDAKAAAVRLLPWAAASLDLMPTEEKIKHLESIERKAV